MTKTFDIQVSFNGKAPSFCSGKWEIQIDEHHLTCKGEMNTQGTYSTWYFGGESGWEEVWENHESGLGIEEWVKNPPKQLMKQMEKAGIDPCPELLRELYSHIQPLDWRHLSCGGCI